MKGKGREKEGKEEERKMGSVRTTASSPSKTTEKGCSSTPSPSPDIAAHELSKMRSVKRVIIRKVIVERK